ncbi:MAG: hypothetical protein AB4911_01175 [Oscillochloridaceae bacterium umkhey_bin13]
MEALQSGAVPDPAPPAPRPTLPSVPTERPAATGMAPTMTGSNAPDPATAAPTQVPTYVPTPVTPPPNPTFPPLSLPTPEPLTNEARWRAQQIDRQPFASPLVFRTTGSELWWYDPLQQQHVILGRIAGDFLGQASFTLRGQGIQALEVPYQVGVGYGLTALSPALNERIRAAGFGDWIETYVFQNEAVTPR